MLAWREQRHGSLGKSARSSGGTRERTGGDFDPPGGLCAYLAFAPVRPLRLSGLCACLAFAPVWPSRLSGLCACLAFAPVWPLRLSGLCAFLAFAPVWPLRPSGLCACLAFAPVWPLRLSGLRPRRGGVPLRPRPALSSMQCCSSPRRRGAFLRLRPVLLSVLDVTGATQARLETAPGRGFATPPAGSVSASQFVHSAPFASKDFHYEGLGSCVLVLASLDRMLSCRQACECDLMMILSHGRTS